MKAPIEWLEDQLERVKGEKEIAEQRFESAKAEMQEAQRRFEACTQMLAIAKQAQIVEIKRAVSKRGETGGARPKVGMPDHMTTILREHGPMSSLELFEALKTQGWEKTSLNSVNTQLSRYKDMKFKKNDEGKWALVDAV